MARSLESRAVAPTGEKYSDKRESLSQGSKARQRMIEANRRAWGAKSAEGPEASKKPRRTRTSAKATRVGQATLALGSLAFIACGGRASSPEDQAEPQITSTPTAESFTPTPEPTATLITEPSPTVERTLTLSELKAIVDEALSTIPETIDVMNVRNALNDGEKAMAGVEADIYSAQDPLNAFGDAAQRLAGIACSYPENSELARGWVALKTFETQYGLGKETTGELGTGYTDRFLEIYFNIPANCPNPFMVVE